ncbi:hypothetical protein ACFL2C_04100 [Patescibacteria group bacterium]
MYKVRTENYTKRGPWPHLHILLPTDNDGHLTEIGLDPREMPNGKKDSRHRYYLRAADTNPELLFQLVKFIQTVETQLHKIYTGDEESPKLHSSTQYAYVDPESKEVGPIAPMHEGIQQHNMTLSKKYRKKREDPKTDWLKQAIDDANVHK